MSGTELPLGATLGGVSEPLKYPELRGENVTLRSWRHSDIPTLIEGMTDVAVEGAARKAPRGFTYDDAEQWLRQQEFGRVGRQRMNLAIATPYRDSALGLIGLTDFEWDNQSAWIGYWILPAARGRGLASAALRLLCPWAFDELGLERLQLTTAPDNEPSQRLAERCGFVREGLLRSHLRRVGGRRDSVLYSLLPSDLTR